MSKTKKWTTRDYTIVLNGSQIDTILKALADQSVNRGEYKATYDEFVEELSEAGYWRAISEEQ